MMRSLPLSLLALAACQEYGLGGAKESSDDRGSYYDYDSTDAGPPSDGEASSTATTEPESEEDFLKLEPAATDAYVFVANPDRATVTRISVPGLQVETRAVGAGPVAVATTEDYTRAVTLNVDADSMSVIDAATFGVTDVPIRENLNQLSLSPDGRWAMAWYDPDADDEGQNEGVHSFNEVSFVRLDTAVHTPMAVGFNPRGVRWTPDGSKALVVSDGSLAVIDLTADLLEPLLIDIAEDPLDAPPAEEVEITPDGRYAFVRQFGAEEILVVALVDLTVDSMPVGINPTDLDLTPSGGEIAVVARGSREIWVFDALNPYDEPLVVPFPTDSPYGSVIFAGNGDRAVLYTNASDLTRYAVWDTTDDSVIERTIVKPIQSVGLSPTGGSLLLFHTREDAADADPDSPFAGKWALTLVDMDDHRQNPMALTAEPSAYTTTDDGRYGFFIMEGEPYLETLVFDTLLYDEVKLKSDPVFVGALPGTDVAWASQEHDLGRISFYDADNGTLDTVTGFELNAEIDHEE